MTDTTHRSRLTGRAAVVLAGLLTALPAGPQASAAPRQAAAVSSLNVRDIAGSAAWPADLRRMLTYALSLTERKLSYRYGSASPANGGMDCSGTVWHVLNRMGYREVPRTSAEMFEWVRRSGRLTRVNGTPALTDPVFARLRPGDLLFWTGTWNNGRPGAISHVMIYLGRTKDGTPVMVGASDGRRYEGQRRSGVSVFDFRMPRPDTTARFAGFGPVPGMNTAGIPAVPPAGPPAGGGQDSRSRKSR